MKHRREAQELEVGYSAIVTRLLAFQDAFVKDDGSATLPAPHLPAAGLRLAVCAPAWVVAKADGLRQTEQQRVDTSIEAPGRAVHRHAAGTLIPGAAPGNDALLQCRDDLIRHLLVVITFGPGWVFFVSHFTSPFPNPTPWPGRSGKGPRERLSVRRGGPEPRAAACGEHGEDPPFAWAARAAVIGFLYGLVSNCHCRQLLILDSGLIKHFGENIVCSLAGDRRWRD